MTKRWILLTMMSLDDFRVVLGIEFLVPIELSLDFNRFEMCYMNAFSSLSTGLITTWIFFRIHKMSIFFYFFFSQDLKKLGKLSFFFSLRSTVSQVGLPHWHKIRIWFLSHTICFNILAMKMDVSSFEFESHSGVNRKKK